MEILLGTDGKILSGSKTLTKKISRYDFTKERPSLAPTYKSNPQKERVAKNPGVLSPKTISSYNEVSVELLISESASGKGDGAK